jgi:hypothetical protein
VLVGLSVAGAMLAGTVRGAGRAGGPRMGEVLDIHG